MYPPSVISLSISIPASKDAGALLCHLPHVQPEHVTVGELQEQEQLVEDSVLMDTPRFTGANHPSGWVHLWHESAFAKHSADTKKVTHQVLWYFQGQAVPVLATGWAQPRT